ncbi:MAG: tRNA pseudouridine(38-40) synthase TruA [Phycisphaerales bacterium]|nr:tRNA pseudouridine(38-40) synthase TruA [Phycisphaerales bacterium]
MRYRLTIAYDGTAFHGWQRQFVGSPDDHPDTKRPELRTVQSVVAEAIRNVVREPIELVGASRTDSGVHARAQTAAFTTTDTRLGPPDERLMLAINSQLPDDVIITACARTRDDFNPIRDCMSKGYRYLLWTGRDRPLWERNLVHHIWMQLDEVAMHDAAQVLVGEHDFAAFAAANHGRDSTVRTIHACTVTRLDEHQIAIDVSGNGFLYNMVRIIAGTLVEVGRTKMDVFHVERALASLDRRNAGPTLPPTGLCLMWMEYPEPDGFVGEKP